MLVEIAFASPAHAAVDELSHWQSNETPILPCLAVVAFVFL